MVLEVLDNPDDTVENVHYATMQPGTVRGNHVHHDTHERIVFPNNVPELYLGNGPVSNPPEQPLMVDLPPGAPHAFFNNTDQPIHFLAWTDNPYKVNAATTESTQLITQENQND